MDWARDNAGELRTIPRPESTWNPLSSCGRTYVEEAAEEGDSSGRCVDQGTTSISMFYSLLNRPYLEPSIAQEKCKLICR